MWKSRVLWDLKINKYISDEYATDYVRPAASVCVALNVPFALLPLGRKKERKAPLTQCENTLWAVRDLHRS